MAGELGGRAQSLPNPDATGLLEFLVDAVELELEVLERPRLAWILERVRVEPVLQHQRGLPKRWGGRTRGGGARSIVTASRAARGLG